MDCFLAIQLLLLHYEESGRTSSRETNLLERG